MDKYLFFRIKMKLYLLSLGCARNLVDSEIMLGRIKGAGWTIVEEPEEADAIVVNTCSFIEDAADESIDMILELAQYKQTGSCKRLVVAGCLPERYRQEITGQMPEVDAFIGTGAYDQIVAAVAGSNYRGGCLLPDPDIKPAQDKDASRVLSASHMAYLKVAEGCSRHCTYCIIPLLSRIQSQGVLGVFFDGLIAEPPINLSAVHKRLDLIGGVGIELSTGYASG
jgi:ribosomal protein S12 methylthiotransferase